MPTGSTLASFCFVAPPHAWFIATRPCSIEADARPGKPTRSPAAYTCGTAVW